MIDVVSVKFELFCMLWGCGVDFICYIGLYFFVGRECGGVILVCVDLFIGWFWVVCCDEEIKVFDFVLVEVFVLDVGVMLFEMIFEEYDCLVVLIFYVL